MNELMKQALLKIVDKMITLQHLAVMGTTQDDAYVSVQITILVDRKDIDWKELDRARIELGRRN